MRGWRMTPTWRWRAPCSNWRWRCPAELLTLDIAEKLKALTVTTDRDGIAVEPMPHHSEIEATAS